MGLAKPCEMEIESRKKELLISIGQQRLSNKEKGITNLQFSRVFAELRPWYLSVIAHITPYLCSFTSISSSPIFPMILLYSCLIWLNCMIICSWSNPPFDFFFPPVTAAMIDQRNPNLQCALTLVQGPSQKVKYIHPPPPHLPPHAREEVVYLSGKKGDCL